MAGRLNTNLPTQPLHYTEFIMYFRYTMYHVTLLRNLSLTWFLYRSKVFRDSFSEPAKQNYYRANVIFTKQHYYYYFSLWFLNICSYSSNLLFTYLWVYSHLLYTLTQFYALIHIYTHIHTILHIYPSIHSSYTHISPHSLIHSLTHLVSHIRSYTITHSSKY